VIINTASASAPFLAKLSATNRVVITATRSGNEQNFTRLGEHLAATIADPAGDLDKDGQTSLLEAFLTAAARVAEFYQAEGRLATEHALIDDNGDGPRHAGRLVPRVRAVKKSQQAGAVDGLRAQQISLLLSPTNRRCRPRSVPAATPSNSKSSACATPRPPSAKTSTIAASRRCSSSLRRLQETEAN